MSKIKRRKVIGLIVLVIGMISLCGCSVWGNFKEKSRLRHEAEMERLEKLIDEQNNERRKLIKKKLEDKYGEAFVITYIGKNTNVMLAGDIVANCYPLADSTLNFTAMLDLETGEVKDKYLCQLVGRNEEPIITEYIKTLWAENKVSVTNDSGIVYPSKVDQHIRHEEFIKLYPGSWQQVDIFLKGPNTVEEINQEEEIEKYHLLAQWLADNKYFKTAVSIIYLQQEAYTSYDEIRKTAYPGKYYADHKEDCIHAIVRINIDKSGKLQQSTEEFKEKFKLWIKE